MNPNSRFIPILIAIATVPLHPATGADWNEYRGTDNNGISPESVQVKWPESGPKSLWKTPAGSGFSSFTISGKHAFTLITEANSGTAEESIAAFDPINGKRLWATPIGIAKYPGGGDDGTKDNRGGDGPRSTPVTDGKRVYAYSADLVLTALDASTGKKLWSHDIPKEYGGQNISWKNATSPVLDNGLLFVAGGGQGQSLLAFNPKSGDLAWKSSDEKLTHASPVPATILGTRQIIFFLQSGLVSVKADNGQVLWRYPFRYTTSTAASPVVDGDIVYCAAGYGVGAGAVRITHQNNTWTATELYRLPGNKPVANHWSTPVAYQGHLYGMFSFKEYGNGPLKCVEIATGKVKWEQPGFGAGNVILAKDTLLALSDNGQLVAVKASPDAYSELARAKVIDGKCWSTPSLSQGRVYLRSTREAVCLELGSAKGRH